MTFQQGVTSLPEQHNLRASTRVSSSTAPVIIPTLFTAQLSAQVVRNANVLSNQIEPLGENSATAMNRRNRSYSIAMHRWRWARSLKLCLSCWCSASVSPFIRCNFVVGILLPLAIVALVHGVKQLAVGVTRQGRLRPAGMPTCMPARAAARNAEAHPAGRDSRRTVGRSFPPEVGSLAIFA